MRDGRERLKVRVCFVYSDNSVGGSGWFGGEWGYSLLSLGLVGVRERCGEQGKAPLPQLQGDCNRASMNTSFRVLQGIATII